MPTTEDMRELREQQRKEWEDYDRGRNNSHQLKLMLGSQLPGGSTDCGWCGKPKDDPIHK